MPQASEKTTPGKPRRPRTPTDKPNSVNPTGKAETPKPTPPGKPEATPGRPETPKPTPPGKPDTPKPPKTPAP
jgi:hypothetical protein